MADKNFIQRNWGKIYKITFCLVYIFSFIVILSILFLNTYSKGSSYTKCNDGTISHSRGQGTCSHHGGVDEYIDPTIQRNYTGFVDMIKNIPHGMMNKSFLSNVGIVLFGLIFSIPASMLVITILMILLVNVFRIKI